MINGTKMDQAEFIQQARVFIRDSLGKDGADIDPDMDLIRTGTFDSLSLISFLCFIEGLRGLQLLEVPDLSGTFSLRSAYGLVTR